MPNDDQTHRPTQVLCMGLFRTGTLSMATALETIGYENIYHGVRRIDALQDWALFNRAADATFPSLPTYTGKPFSRDQWDELFGPFDGITDMGACFGMELVRAYPDARVVLIERDVDRWWRSVADAVVDSLWSRVGSFSVHYVEPLIGSEAGMASRKILLGWARVQSVEALRLGAKDAYRRHYLELREQVPPERLLDFKMEDGWGPLCEFLGKDVPDGPFPRSNEAAEIKRVIIEKARSNFFKALGKVAPYLVAAVAIGAGVWTCNR